MIWRLLAAVALASVVAACGTDGAPQYGGATPGYITAYGDCATCHGPLADKMFTYGGHGSVSVKCESCHPDLTPGQVGPGHRAIPRCADCHSVPQTHHDPAIGTTAECTQCHTPHGSPNLSLVNQAIDPPEGPPQPIIFTNRQGKADGSFASTSAPGSGVCEVCHTTTAFYRSDGQGAAHFTTTCPLCHTHAQSFDVTIPPSFDVYGECALCHTPIADSLFVYEGHGSYDVKCENCHANLKPDEFGPGHRAIPRCIDCHTVPQTHHDPAIGTTAECTQCHTPHGSPNLSLVNQIIDPPDGPPQPITFTNRQGKADGSFASASDPGSGVCEVCHTTTAFYRSDGQGAAHFTATCPLCHTHAQGFEIVVPPSFDVYGECALCHTPIADSLYVYQGHAGHVIKCEVCHQNVEPGEFGPGHRAVPSCTDCHTVPQTHHDLAIGTTAECTQCHTPHGSPNLSLVNQVIEPPDGPPQPITFTNRQGKADGSFASASDPGSGVCEVCHTTTAFYRSDGQGAAHFTSTCPLCHTHAQSFEITVPPSAEVYGECALCHTPIADSLFTNNGHAGHVIKCEVCHQNLVPGEFGPGHRAVPSCTVCHTDEQTHHDPAIGTTAECTQCHTPHGSPNLSLINQVIVPTGGTPQPITFTNRQGKADGSFASASDPGSGVCEVCHTTTAFYRSNGQGAPHVTTTCTVCHEHELGFLPGQNLASFGTLRAP